ncbi:hypothetical protein BTW10_13870 [Chromohalobacter japonicus]|uniref:Helicase n=2 Tax=Chromohalobacter japonicus TaxID=223900 RepID=A0A1Q8TAR3_9GAMM|nr:hypothetical protein BTW10_13870 [Chromohalobacter japonicus]
MRLEIRDAEWRLTRLDHTSDGGQLLSCTGLSELVRGREAQFLTRLEDDIRILDPATTELVDDLSQGHRAGLLTLATQLRDTTPTDNRIQLGHHAAMDALPFQLEPTRQALDQPRPRLLIADAVGLGKTWEAGILTSELIARGRIIFTLSKGLAGIDLPRKANKKELDQDIQYYIESPERTGSSKEYNLALGWEEVKEMTQDVVRKAYLDAPLPGVPEEKTIEYYASFTRPGSEKDDEQAWAIFEKESA